MVSIVVTRKGKDEFEISIFREDSDIENNGDGTAPKEDRYQMYHVERTAIRQIERYFKRRLNDEYFQLLKQSDEEERKIRKLYEVRTMR